MEFKAAFLFLAVLLFLYTPSAHAQETQPDAEGCKDSPLITRMPGSFIATCTEKEYDQFAMTVGRNDDGDINKNVEGEYHDWTYNTREGTSEIQVFRNVETALKKGGFIIDYSNPTGLITAHKGNTWFNMQNSGSYYIQTIVAAKEMQQEMTADASSLAGEIEKSGHVAVYGIHFETAQANILPDSEKTLQQIAQLLAEHSDWKMRVEGYTDNVGQAAANQALSQKRAQAVVTWLTGHSVEASRLAAKGLGAASPVADNSSEDGRAKNRRVELVKM
ncbi:MAG TPA: OmpA family protein [Candidatus Acidoferrales bacterium]|nr:OmpA family protein [Candidatus Acidoferrales bacterium]